MSIWSYIGFSILSVSVLLLAMFVSWRLFRNPNRHTSYRTMDEWTWDMLDQTVKDTFLAWTSDLPLDLYRNEEDYSREMKRRVSLRKTLRTCCSGDVADKEYIKEWIVDMLKDHIKLSKGNSEQLLPVDRPELLTSQDKFDLLLYAFKKAVQFR
ncbi:hypothetical protein AZ66_16660 [Paenibacillus sp. E194]|uniref:hypothetical protein n=1 Tax=Paenibacillus sp. E194 TaxID=1458845 RepID=UPI0005CA3A98|nr:hypothetical protein [Paenibacillus sp. E194]KJB86830.1 hypothetical protein AZ66_16660 [Paenibacillus sp. E194]